MASTAILIDTPNDAQAATGANAGPMIFPTIRTLEQLADYPSAGEALKALAREGVRTVKPTLVIAPAGGGKRRHGDD